MMSQKLPNFLTYFWISFILSLIGWGGLVALLITTVPTLPPRWLFFFLWFVALTGTTIPIMYFLNRRFPSDPPVEGGVVVREAMWVGVYGAIVAWLQLGRVLTTGLMIVLAFGLILVEFLLRIGERSAWSPAPAGVDAGADADADAEDETSEDEEDDA